MAMYNEITVTAELTNTEYMITKNYNLLENKPQINSVELMGNKSLEDLGINPDAEENVIDTVKVNGSALTPDADKAVNVTVTTGSDNGTVKVNGSDVAVKGLKSAAFTEATAYDAAGSAAEVQGNVDALTVVVNGKVDKVQGKGLSQNDFTNAYKTKLDGIEAGAQVNKVTSVNSKTGAVVLEKSDVGLGNVDNTSDLNKPISTATQTALNAKADTSAVNTALAGKVDKVAGKGLSTEDFTTAEKTKLAGIEAEANKTVVDSAISSSSTNPVQNKAIYDLINNLLPEKTETGNTISISDASGFNAKSAKVTMLPIQSGSGDPSPTNIRPISGRNSVSLTACGKNLFDISSENNAIRGLSIPQGTVLYSITTYTTTARLYIGFADGTQTTWDLTTTKSSYTAAKNIVSLAFGTITWEYIKSANKDVMVSLFDFDTLEPYNGQTYTATFPSTVIGGEYEFVEGGLTDNRKIIDLGSCDYIKSSHTGYNVFRTTISDKKSGNSTLMCSNYKYESNKGFTVSNASISDSSGSSYLATVFIRDDNYNDYTEAEFKTAMNGVQLCYELATPTTTTLTPQSISLNKGANVLTTDGDNAEVKYSVSLDSLLPT